jgi:hypothetical protein
MKQWKDNKKYRNRSWTPEDNKIIVADDKKIEESTEQQEELIDIPRHSPRNSKNLSSKSACSTIQ